jgi:hypothetical protein
MKDNSIFQNIKDNINALTLNFWQTYVQCYELNKVIVWYGFYTNFEQISYYNRKYKGYWICNWQPLNNFTILYLFYMNKLMQKHNENVFTNTLGLTFIFKAMDINHQSCPPSYKLSNYPSKIASLYFIINIKKIGGLNYVLVTMQHLMVLWMELMACLKH